MPLFGWLSYWNILKHVETMDSSWCFHGLFHTFSSNKIILVLPHLAIEDALQEHRLGLLGAHVRVAGLLGHEDAPDLAQLLVDLKTPCYHKEDDMKRSNNYPKQKNTTKVANESCLDELYHGSALLTSISMAPLPTSNTCRRRELSTTTATTQPGSTYCFTPILLQAQNNLVTYLKDPQRFLFTPILQSSKINLPEISSPHKPTTSNQQAPNKGHTLLVSLKISSCPLLPSACMAGSATAWS